jgi:hypothetical protein
MGIHPNIKLGQTVHLQEIRNFKSGITALEAIV